MGTTLSTPASDRVGNGLVADPDGQHRATRWPESRSEAWLRALFTTAMFQEISD